MAFSIVTNSISSITSTSATSGGNTITGSGTISSKGICWNTSGSPTISNSHTTISGNSSANFSSNLTSLSAGTTYYVRSYVTDSLSNTYYGNQISFITQNIVTTSATSITFNSALSGGTFTGITGTISSVGVCWDISSNPDPDINDTKTIDVVIGGSFTSVLYGLLPNTTYKVRCYVNTNVGVVYGDVKTFTTSSVIPTVTTNTSGTSTGTTITIGGNVTASGGATVTSRGIQRSIYPDMSSPSSTTMSSGTGTFSGTITGLNSGTTYYLRAFAVNSNGTAYGAIISIATIGGPTLTTVNPYSITSSSCVTGCDIISDGGTTITARGVCFSNTQTLPSIGNSTVINDLYPAQTEPFITQLQNLTKDTTYYIRAFATNSVSTLYGELEIFSTTVCSIISDECEPEMPVIQCSDNSCKYIIPLNCVIGDLTSVTSCDNVNLKPDYNTLLSELIKINNTLCTLSSKDNAIFILGSIVNNPALSSVFCNLTSSCE